MVKTIDATTTDRLRRSPLYLDLSPSCARKRACMELTTICRFQRLLNPSFQLFQCFRSIAYQPSKIVLRNLMRFFTKKSCYNQGFFAVKRRAVFILGSKWVALVRGWRMGLCGWRHGNSFPMTQSAHSLCQMRSIPHCPKAVFYVFVFYSIHNSAIKLIIAPPCFFPLNPFIPG